MARKERNDVDYFPHSVNHGKKMFYIRSTFGNDGYAVWFMLLEHLGKATYHYLDLSDDVEIMYLSSELKVTDTVLKEIIKSLVKLGEFDKELWDENSILFNEKFVNNISDAYKKRNNNCIDKNSLLTLLEHKGLRKQGKSNPKPPKSDSKGDGNPQSKEEYSKEKKSIENIYQKYPTKCPIKNSSTGKTKENKDKIKKLLIDYSEDVLTKAINSYIEDCKKSKTYIKNFSTFLNNIPEEYLTDKPQQNKVRKYAVDCGDRTCYYTKEFFESENMEQGGYTIDLNKWIDE